MAKNFTSRQDFARCGIQTLFRVSKEDLTDIEYIHPERKHIVQVYHGRLLLYFAACRHGIASQLYSPPPGYYP